MSRIKHHGEIRAAAFVTVQALIFRWTRAQNRGKLILGAAGL
jgi:hypothetical protein